MDGIKSIRDFASEGFFGPGISDVLLSCGSEGQIGKVPTRWQHLHGPKKQCYRNSTEIALQYPGELLYTEGYAFADIPLLLPIAHAWLQTPEGLVVDPTWDAGLEYFGISFPLEELTEYLQIHKEYGILQSLWMNRELRESFVSHRELVNTAFI